MNLLGLEPSTSLSGSAWKTVVVIVIGRTDPEAEAPVLRPSNEKKRLPGKDPDVGKV